MIAQKVFRRITDDFKHKELLPLKMLFFVHASTVLVLYPYLTIHMRELGISVEEAAIMSAVTPVVAIVMPPVAGVIADRVGNFKLLLALFSTVGGLSALLLLAVPVGRYNVKYPDRVFLSVGCTDSSLEAAWADLNPCRVTPWSDNPADPVNAVNVTLESCGVVCTGDLADRGHLNRTLRRASRFSLRVAGAAHSDTFSYGLRPDHTYSDARLLPGSTPTAYFTTPGLHTLDCNMTGTTTCSLGRDEPPGQGNPLDRLTAPHRLTVALEPLQSSDSAAVQPRWRLSSLGPAGRPGSQDGQPVCSDAFTQEGRSAAVWLSASEPEDASSSGPSEPASSLSRCVSACLVSTPRARFCSNAQDVVELDPSLTFWMYLTVRVFVGVISGTSFAMFEGAVIAILREHNGDYGLQRIYASIGGMISSPLSGILIDYASYGKHSTDFRPAFYLYAALKLASGVLMLRIDLQFKAPAKNVVGAVLDVLKSVEMVSLFIVCFLLGTAWGYIENFLFWLLQDLGGSRSLMGITVTVGGVAGIPLLVASGPIIKRVGHANVLFIGFVFYAIRLFGYSIIYNPWLCLVFEAMESFTSSLATTAAVTYAATLSSSSTDTSVQGLVGGLYYGVGKGAGSLIGGFLMKMVGTRNTFRLFAAGSLGAGCVYFLFNRFYLRHHKTVESVEKKPDEKDHEACMQVAEMAEDKSRHEPPTSAVIGTEKERDSPTPPSPARRYSLSVSQDCEKNDSVRRRKSTDCGPASTEQRAKEITL